MISHRIVRRNQRSSEFIAVLPAQIRLLPIEEIEMAELGALNVLCYPFHSMLLSSFFNLLF